MYKVLYTYPYITVCWLPVILSVILLNYSLTDILLNGSSSFYFFYVSNDYNN